MRRAIVLLLVFVLTACGGQNTEIPEQNASTTEQTAQDTAPATPQPAEPAPAAEPQTADTDLKAWVDALK